MRHPLNRETVLCQGHDEMLLMTRQRLLESIGLQVIVVSTAAEFNAELQSVKPALILLCQSKPTSEATICSSLS
jgi:hypothetical protein